MTDPRLRAKLSGKRLLDAVPRGQTDRSGARVLLLARAIR
jgi:hypothetical protein